MTAKNIREQYDEFIGAMRAIEKPAKMDFDTWLKTDRISANNYCKLVYESTYQVLEFQLGLKKRDKATANPYKRDNQGRVNINMNRRGLIKEDTRVQLIKIGELSSGLEIPFIKTWDKLPDKITTVQQMAQIFVEAKADKRLATAKNMIRRAVQRGDAVVIK